MPSCCAVDGCVRLPRARGWCEPHWLRWKRSGDVQAHIALRTYRDPASSFWRKVDRSSSGCWLWKAAKDIKGYGLFSSYSAPVKAHRFAYELLVGPIPESLALDHLCRITSCVNPAHLEPVTAAENTRRQNSARRAAA